MSQEQPNNRLHGVTLKEMLQTLVDRHGWPELGELLPIRCFTNDPSIQSSLKFLRMTDWARVKVEELYLAHLRRVERNRKRKARRAIKRAYDEKQAREDQAEAGSDNEVDVVMDTIDE